MEHNLPISPKDFGVNINSLFRSVPLGMSKYQVEKFVVEQGSESRTYRQVAIELFSRYRTLADASFKRKRTQIDIEELEQKIKEETNDFNRRRLEVDLEEKLFDIDQENILIEDYISEIQVLFKALSTLPEFNREDFEKAEPEYWYSRLTEDATREIATFGSIQPGTQKALEQIGTNPLAERIRLTDKLNSEAQKLLPGQ